MLRKVTNENDPADWFYLADDRIKAADLLWKHEGLSPTGIECLQEAAERYLKGYLIAKQWPLEKIHDLERLVDYASSFDISFKKFERIALELTEEFFAQHYPGGDLTSFGENYETMRAEVG